MRRSSRAAGAFLLAAIGQAAAAPLPGLGAADPRVTVDPAAMPWAAVARLNVPGVSRCSAVMVAPRWAVTAMHCLFSPALGGLIPPSAVHLLLGYADGRFSQHLVADEIRLPPGTRPGAPPPQGSDIALVHLPQDALAVLPPYAPAIAPGVRLMAGGYGQDRAERLAIDPDCTARGYGAGRDGQPMLRHDCAATRGASGGPVLARDASGGWRLVGIAVAAQTGSAGGVAATGDAIARLLSAQP